MTKYKTEIGLRQTKIIDGKEVFVDWRGRPDEPLTTNKTAISNRILNGLEG